MFVPLFMFSFCNPNPKRIISKCNCNNQVGKHLRCFCCGGICFEFWMGNFFYNFVQLLEPNTWIVPLLYCP